MGFGRKTIGFVVGALIAALLVAVPGGPVLAIGSQSAVLPGSQVFVSSSSAGSVDGVSFTSGDILLFDSGADAWSMFFDGSDVGLGSANVDGFNIVDATPSASVVEMSFAGPVTITGLGSIDDSDVVTFTGVTGAATSGSFAKLIDGSDVGLTSGGEDIDALTAVDGGYGVSTLGTGSVPRTGGGTLSVADEDIVVLTGTTGAPTTGSFATLLDGSDVGFTTDLVSAWVDTTTGEIYGSSLNNYNIDGLSGDGDDIIVFTGSTGPTSSGTFALFFDGDQHRFGGEQIDGLHIIPGTPPPPGSADLAITVSTDVIGAAVAGDTVVYTVDVTNNGPDPSVNVVVTSQVPAGLTFVSTTGCAADPSGLPCSLGTIAPNNTASFGVSTTVDTGTLGNVTVAVEATAGTADPVSANNTADDSFLVSGPPVAVADGPSSSSAPGSLFHTDTDTTYNLAAPGLLGNDTLGSPAGSIASFGGGDLGGSVADNAAGAAASVGTGSLVVEADGSLMFNPDTGFQGPFSFQYRLSNPGGSSDAEVTIYVGPRPSAGAGGNLVYVSTSGSGTVDGITFDDEDILLYNTDSDTWAMFFDGSDVGLSLNDLNGFNVVSVDPTPVLELTFAAPMTIAGITGQVDDSDVVTFTATSIGETTAGAFELLIDGSDVQLSSGGEDIDAFTRHGTDLAFSTWGAHNAGGVAGSDEDIVAFTATGTGPVTTGTFAQLFDGSDVDLAAEDISGASIDPATGDLYAATLGGFNIPNLTGDNDDVFVFAGTLGSSTTGTFSIFFDGDAVRFGGNQIDGLHIMDGSDANLAPTLPATVAVGVAENQTAVTDLDAGDDTDTEPGGGLTYTKTGGADVALFNLDTGTGVLTFNPAPDFEAPGDSDTDNDYVVEVTVTDSGGLTAETVATVTVTDVNEAPSITSSATSSVVENQTGAVDVDATDPEGETESGGGLTYTITGGADDTLFSIDTDTGVLTFDTAPDFENPGDDDTNNDYVVEVTVTDSGGLDDVQDITVTVIDDGNLAPTLPATVAVDAAENQTDAADLDAGDDTDTEPGGGLTYTKTGGADAALFNLDTGTGVLTFITAPDFEAPGDSDTDNNYVVEVTVADSEGLVAVTTVTVTVTDVDEAPSITSPANPSVVEGETTAVDVEATDPEGDTESGGGLTYAITGGADDTLFSIDTDTGVLTFDTAPDFEAPGDDDGDNDYEVQITVTDSGGLEYVQDITVTVIDDGNLAPTLPVAVGVVLAENQTAVVDLNAGDDVDTEVGGGLTYSLSGGVDEARFEVVVATGVVTFNPAPDFEAPGDSDTDNDYVVEVTVTDSGGLTAEIVVIVTVTDVNEAPSITSSATSSVVENQTGAVDVEASDPEGDTESGGGLTYAITGGADDALFSVDTDTGVLTFDTAPDFEAPGDDDGDNDYEVQITVTDSGGLDDVQDITVTVIDDGNLAPTLPATVAVDAAENQTDAADLDAGDDTDTEPGGGLTYTKTGGADAALFNLDTGTGVLTFITAPDFEAPGDSDTDNDYVVEVTVADSEGLAAVTTVTVTVTDALGFPAQLGGDGSDQGLAVAVDGSGNSYITGQFSGIADFDPDPVGTFELTSSSSSSDVFVAKLDIHGELQWAASMGGTGNDTGTGIALDGSGNLYVTGNFSDTADFDPDPTASSELTSDGLSDGFVVKLTTSGDYVWAGRFGGTTPDGGNAVAVDSSGDAYITGSFFSPTADFDPDPAVAFTLTRNGVAGTGDAFVLKLTSNGDFVWAGQLSGSDSEVGLAVAVDSSDNAWVTGSFEGTVDFDPDLVDTEELTSGGLLDGFVIKLASDGDLLLAAQFGGSNNAEGFGVAVDGGDNAWVTGSFLGTVDFDPDLVDTEELTSGGLSDGFVIKLASDGDLVWAGQLGGLGSDTGSWVAVDGSDNAWVTGSFEATADFDPDLVDTEELISGGGLDGFVVKLASDGGFVSASRLGGSDNDAGKGVGVDATGNAYVTGSFQGTADFDPDPVATSELASNSGSVDAFVVQIQP